MTIVAERWTDPKNRITSQIAGALWEWPPAVCGKHTDVISLHNSKRWCMTSYRVFEKLEEMFPASDFMDHGVRMKMANFFFDQVLEDMPDKGQLEKFEEICAQLDVSITFSWPMRQVLTSVADQGCPPGCQHHH